MIWPEWMLVVQGKQVLLVSLGFGPLADFLKLGFHLFANVRMLGGYVVKFLRVFFQVKEASSFRGFAHFCGGSVDAVANGHAGGNEFPFAVANRQRLAGAVDDMVVTPLG